MTVALNALAAKAATTLTISSGVVTVTQTIHIIAAESGTSDDLDTITVGFSDLTAAGNNYRPLLLLTADTGDTITIKYGVSGADNLDLVGGKDLTLTPGAWLLLMHNGTAWQNIGCVAQTAAYTTTNVTPDRSFDADTALIAETNDVLGTLIADLQAAGIIG